MCMSYPKQEKKKKLPWWNRHFTDPQSLCICHISWSACKWENWRTKFQDTLQYWSEKGWTLRLCRMTGKQSLAWKRRRSGARSPEREACNTVVGTRSRMSGAVPEERPFVDTHNTGRSKRWLHQRYCEVACTHDRPWSFSRAQPARLSSTSVPQRRSSLHRWQGVRRVTAHVQLARHGAFNLDSVGHSHDSEACSLPSTKSCPGCAQRTIDQVLSKSSAKARRGRLVRKLCIKGRVPCFASLALGN